MKFAVCVHLPYRETDGGLNCILNLAKMLSDRGHDANVYVPPNCLGGYENNTIYPHYIDINEMEEDRVAIYIDCTTGNPLRAKKVVRYITYGSHWYPEYDTNEIVYYHFPFCKNNKTTKFLTPIYWPSGLENKGQQRINNQCHILKKGINCRAVRVALDGGGEIDPYAAESIDISGMNHEQLINIFNTTRYFYCFDPCCFLVVIALMCGCVVIQFPVEGCSAEEWKYMVGMGLNGVAYGRENLAYAEATIGDAPAECLALKKRSEDSLTDFLNDMETENYTTEPCYPFNDSPYSLQHRWK